MFKRLAQQKKQSHPQATSASIEDEKKQLSIEQIQQKVQEELGLCKLSETKIEFSVLCEDIVQQNQIAEELVIMKRLVDDVVLQMTYNLSFPDVNNLLHFKFVVNCGEHCKQRIIVGEENIALVENCLSPSTVGGRISYQVTEDMKKNDKSASNSNISVTYRFDFKVDDKYPNACPKITLDSVTDDNKQAVIQEEMKNLFNDTTDFSQYKNMQTLIEKLKQMVTAVEKKDISERTHLECKRLLKIQNECLQDSQFLISESLVKEGKSLMKSDTGVVKSAVYNGKPVALKTLLYKTDGSELPELIEETSAVCKLSSPHIIQYYGYFLVREKYYLKILMQHAPKGTLHDLIHKKIKDAKLAHEAKTKLSDSRVLFQIAKSVALGLQYLHSQGIIHRNLKTQHVLIQDDWMSQIGIDLKHCYYLKENELETPAGIGSIGLPQYKSPEEFANDRQSQKVDIYSYAVLLCELYSKKKPWRDTVSAKICQKVLHEQQRPDLPEGVPSGIIDLISDCWKQNAAERPTIDEVIERLNMVEATL